MKLSTPNDLFFDQLKDIYSVESQVILTLTDLADHATEEALKSLLLEHEGASERQKKTVSAILKRHGVDPGGDICKAMKGLIDGGNEHLAKAEDPLVRDLLLIAHWNRIEHYEIAAYGFTTSLARSLGLTRDAEELAEILEEETTTARQLAEIASGIFGVPAGDMQ